MARRRRSASGRCCFCIRRSKGLGQPLQQRRPPFRWLLPESPGRRRSLQLRTMRAPLPLQRLLSLPRPIRTRRWDPAAGGSSSSNRSRSGRSRCHCCCRKCPCPHRRCPLPRLTSSSRCWAVLPVGQRLAAAVHTQARLPPPAHPGIALRCRAPAGAAANTLPPPHQSLFVAGGTGAHLVQSHRDHRVDPASLAGV
jgi:hypothetical protein